MRNLSLGSFVIGEATTRMPAPDRQRVSSTTGRAITPGFREVTLSSGTMPRKSIGDTPMTGAERQARCRTARASGVPVVHTRRTIDRRSRAQRWRDAVAKLTRLQAHHTAWLEALPSGVQESATAEALQAV